MLSTPTDRLDFASKAAPFLRAGIALIIYLRTVGNSIQPEGRNLNLLYAYEDANKIVNCLAVDLGVIQPTPETKSLNRHG